MAALRGFEPDPAPYIEAFAQLLRLEREADAWLKRHGAALCPVAPDVAPPLRGELRSRRRRAGRPGGKLTLCTYASVLGLPALAVPVARDAAGLPSASSSSAAAAHERALLALGARAGDGVRRLPRSRRAPKPCSGT